MNWTVDLKILAVHPTDDMRLVIDWSDGSRRVFDPHPYLAGDFMGKLSDPEYFNRVKPIAGGASIAWPDGQDFAPETLYEQAAAVS